MSAPRLEACYFDASPTGAYRRMAAVLEATAARHCATWSVNVRAITPAPCRNAIGLSTYTHNTQKLEEWARIVSSSAIGDRLLLIDADTAILRPLEDVWDRDFDLAYTVKPEGAAFPFNGGVVFLRVSARTKAFIECWRAMNAELLADAEMSRHWRAKYGGINQAALGWLLEKGPRADLAPLPCEEWNCEDHTWQRFDPATTRVLHIKGALRRALFPSHRPPQAPPPPEVSRLAALWRNLEAPLLASTDIR